MNTPGRQPLATERRTHVLAALERDGIVRVADLAADLGVTPVTVRRDIGLLEAEGLLVRVHGGARSATAQDVAVDTRSSTHRVPTIGVIVPTLAFYWPDVIHGLELEARRQGVRLTTRTSSYDAVDERPLLDRLVEHDAVDGLIIAPKTDGPGAADLVEWLTANPVPTVLLERSVARSSDHDLVEAVGSDHALGARLAVHHLAEHGHRRVGLVMAVKSPTSRRITDGWRSACAELGLASHEHFERFTPARDTAGFSAMTTEIVDLVRSTGTTGLLVHSDPEAFGIAQKAIELGLDVPGDLSVIAYDDVVANMASPALTAVRPSRETVAAIAVSRVLQRIADPSLPFTRTVVSPRLMVRESTGPAPAHRR
jgi:DNA-binding LacI/PurR family transcriptional regulator